MSKATDTLKFLAIHNSWRRGDDRFKTTDELAVAIRAEVAYALEKIDE